MLAEYLRAGAVERSLSWGQHAITLAITALPLLVNGWWLRTATRFVHYLLDSAFYEQSGLRFVVYDAAGLLFDSSTQGMIGPRTGVRVACLIAAVFGLRAWRASKDRRRLPFLVLILTMAGFTYLGGYTPIAQIQPYRHNLPLGFALLIPAGWWLTRAVGGRPWRGLLPGQRALGLIVVVFAVQHLARDVLYFFAPSLPSRQTVEGGREVFMGALGHALTPGYRYVDQNEWEGLIAWVAATDDGQGRWSVHDQVLGETLMARTKVQLIGGFLVRNIEHSDANWFRREGVEPPYDVEQMRRYFETYAVRWVVLQQRGMSPWWDEHPELLGPRLAGRWPGDLSGQGELPAAGWVGRGQGRGADDRELESDRGAGDRSGDRAAAALSLDGDAAVCAGLCDGAGGGGGGSGGVHSGAGGASERVCDRESLLVPCPGVIASFPPESTVPPPRSRPRVPFPPVPRPDRTGDVSPPQTFSPKPRPRSRTPSGSTATNHVSSKRSHRPPNHGRTTRSPSQLATKRREAKPSAVDFPSPTHSTATDRHPSRTHICQVPAGNTTSRAPPTNCANASQ